MSNVIVVGDSAQVATYVETILQILSLLQALKGEIDNMNPTIQAKLDKLSSDLAALVTARTTDQATIATLTAQVASLTAAQAASDTAVEAGLDTLDQQVETAANPPTPAPTG